MLRQASQRRATLARVARVRVDFSLDFGLEWNERTIMGAVARAVATQHRRNLRSGRDSTGRAIERPDDGGRALRDSGQLIRSIKGYASRRRGRWVATVGATGTRSDVGASLRGRNAGLLGVQIYGRRSEARRPRNPTLMASSPQLDRVAAEAFARVLQRQIDRGRASVVRGRIRRGASVLRRAA